jgi:hypothetical protein
LDECDDEQGDVEGGKGVERLAGSVGQPSRLVVRKEIAEPRAG